MIEGMVIITEDEYKTLLKDARILQALYNGGVDNWEWYEESLEGIDDE